MDPNPSVYKQKNLEKTWFTNYGDFLNKKIIGIEESPTG